jgi:hypothetical protein
VSPENGSAWLLEIGKRLRGEYDAVAEPLPPRLAELVNRFDKLEQESSRTVQPPPAYGRSRL